MIILRVKFSKRGALKFIGHLDVMRYFQKCIRRAGIDVAYSAGFSPHQIMSFASPLGVGLESIGEYMDIEVNSYTTPEEVKDKLNENSVPEIRILKVTELPENAGNAMASVRAASYEVTFSDEYMPDAWNQLNNKKAKWDEYFKRDTILYTKETKKSVREINLKEGIYSLEYIESDNKLILTVDASSAGNIKPGQIVEVFIREELNDADYCIDRLKLALHILRTEMYTGDEQLIPLSEV